MRLYSRLGQADLQPFSTVVPPKPVATTPTPAPAVVQPNEPVFHIQTGALPPGTFIPVEDGSMPKVGVTLSYGGKTKTVQASIDSGMTGIYAILKSSLASQLGLPMLGIVTSRSAGGQYKSYSSKLDSMVVASSPYCGVQNINIQYYDGAVDDLTVGDPFLQSIGAKVIYGVQGTKLGVYFSCTGPNAAKLAKANPTTTPMEILNQLFQGDTGYYMLGGAAVLLALFVISRD